jgi:hypothetical protein
VPAEAIDVTPESVDGPATAGAPRRRSTSTTAPRLAAPILLFASALVAALVREHPMTNSDQGMFLSVMDQLATGAHLYTDVFDNKDPGFFYVGAVWIRLFGPAGVFVWDALLIAIATTISYALARRLRLETFPAIVCSVGTFAALTAGPIYQSGLSQLQAITLFMAAVLALICGLPILAGVLTAACLISKFSMLPFIAVLVPLAWLTARRRSLVRFSVGVAASYGAILLILGGRGELTAYFDVLRLNFGYPGVALPLLGRDPAPIGTLASASDYLFWTSLAIATAIVFAGLALAVGDAFTSVRRGGGRGLLGVPLDHYLAVATAAAFAVHIAASYVWNHHLQILAIPTFFALAVILRPTDGRVAVSRQTAALATVLVLVLLAPADLLNRLRDAPNLRRTWDRSLTSPLAADLTDVVNQSFDGDTAHTRVRIAVVGENRQSAVLPFVPRRFELACRAFAQFPWFGEQLLAETVDCIEREPDVVLVLEPGTPYLRDTTYRSFRREASAILETRFRAVATLSDGEGRVWIRRVDSGDG